MEQTQQQGDRRQSQTQYQGEERRKPADSPYASAGMSTQERKDAQAEKARQQHEQDDHH